MLEAQAVQIVNKAGSAWPQILTAGAAILGVLSTAFFAWRTTQNSERTVTRAELRRDRERHEDWDRERAARFLDQKREAYGHVIAETDRVREAGFSLAMEFRFNQGVFSVADDSYSVDTGTLNDRERCLRAAYASLIAAVSAADLLAPETVRSARRVIASSQATIDTVIFGLAMSPPVSATDWETLAERAWDWLTTLTESREQFNAAARGDLGVSESESVGSQIGSQAD